MSSNKTPTIECDNCGKDIGSKITDQENVYRPSVTFRDVAMHDKESTPVTYQPVPQPLDVDFCNMTCLSQWAAKNQNIIPAAEKIQAPNTEEQVVTSADVGKMPAGINVG